MEHACSRLIEFARLVGEGVTDGPDGRLQLKFSPCLFITLFQLLFVIVWHPGLKCRFKPYIKETGDTY